MGQGRRRRRIDGLADAAAAGGSDSSGKSQFQDLQQALNDSGPFIPLLQPGNNIAAQVLSVTGCLQRGLDDRHRGTRRQVKS